MRFSDGEAQQCRLRLVSRVDGVRFGKERYGLEEKLVESPLEIRRQQKCAGVAPLRQITDEGLLHGWRESLKHVHRIVGNLGYSTFDVRPSTWTLARGAWPLKAQAGRPQSKVEGRTSKVESSPDPLNSTHAPRHPACSLSPLQWIRVGAARG